MQKQIEIDIEENQRRYYELQEKLNQLQYGDSGSKQNA